MTTPYQKKAKDEESEEALEQRLARVRAHIRQRLALETAGRTTDGHVYPNACSAY